MDRLSWKRPVTHMKLINDDTRTIISTFGQYSSKGTIDLDASLVKSFEDIRENLILPRTYEEIRPCIDIISDENLSFNDP